MSTRIKTLTILSAMLASAALAGAQEQPRRPAEFKCPVCGSPCVSKAELVRKLRMRRDAFAPEQARQRFQADREAASQRPERQLNREKRGNSAKFDLDGDGTLSQAERAARRAYRQALHRERRADAAQSPSEE